MIASPISSIIPGLSARTSATAPVRNGQPPQANITVPSTGETQGTHAASGSS